MTATSPGGRKSSAGSSSTSRMQSNGRLAFPWPGPRKNEAGPSVPGRHSRFSPGSALLR